MILVVCVSDAVDVSPLLIRPAPSRCHRSRHADMIDRIIAEYAADAIAELAAPSIGFSAANHAWVREHGAGSLEEIEKARLRLTAIRTSDTVTKAAAQLGMAVPSLLKWIDRRRQPSRRSTTDQAAWRRSAPGGDGPDAR